MRNLILLISLCSVQFILGESYKIYPNNTGKTNNDIEKNVQPDSEIQDKLTQLAATNDQLPKATSNQEKIKEICVNLLNEDQYKDLKSCLILDENNKIHSIITP
jgi:hypothetical protein